MIKKFITALLFISVFSANAKAMVSFELKNTPYFKELKIAGDLMLIADKKQDFIMLYNKKNRVVYIKHKNINKTYKIPLLTISQERAMPIIKTEKGELIMNNYTSDLYSVLSGDTLCFQVYGSKDLGQSLNVSFSSAYALYKAFVYLTGRLQHNTFCRDLVVSNSLGKVVGFPMAVFFGGEQASVGPLKNEDTKIEEYLKSLNINMRKAVELDLNIQYETMLSLLTKEQQDLYLTTMQESSLPVKIKAIDNLLRGF